MRKLIKQSTTMNLFTKRSHLERLEETLIMDQIHLTISWEIKIIKKAENEKNGVKVFCKEPGISNLDFAV